VSGRPFRFRYLIFSLLILAALALLGLYDSLFADLPAPDALDRLVWRDICPLSGRLAGPDCPYSRREVFIAGSKPQTECDQHATVPVDRRTGGPATDDTPAEDMVERVYWLPPPELREWARANGIPQLVGQRVSG